MPRAQAGVFSGGGRLFGTDQAAPTARPRTVRHWLRAS